ncbi:hypothetical protein FSP39_006334 [Pinctada imbricata]|uniref:Uncharacterized protein n=1 Tax=Pinctada imbricata TaxID=66713 RepID=A0AA88YBU1_PINIB|nr:hypothetical protein FSP39_006334 [Pinctada imbricata]
MDEEDQYNLYTIRDVTENKNLSIHDGRGKVFLIGLGPDGSVSAVETREEATPSIYVTLVQLTICENGGMILFPINKDLCCTINDDVVTSEINLLSGVAFEIADRTLKIYQGKMPESSVRRKLPPTPGVVVKTTPPPKPRRSADVEKMMDEENDPKDMYTPPDIDINLLSSIRSPSQLANLAASFLTKQINQYTDSKLSTAITDQIFSFLQEIASYQRSILEAYITEISQSLEEMPEAERSQPLHRPAVRLLVELLRQVMDPLSHVVLCLQLLRTFSHFPQNLVVMVQCQTASAVLGCMTVYMDVVEIQQYGLDVLARIALYKPGLCEKIPLREAAVEMILRAMTHHHRNLHIIQPGCRTLTNLTSMLQEVLDSLLDTEYQASAKVEEEIEKYDGLVRHVFEQAIKVIQSSLQEFPNSLDVRTEGRRFLFNYSKMTQFMQKQKLRSLSQKHSSTEDDLQKSLTFPDRFITNETEEEPLGILRKPQEDTTVTDRRVHFADDSRTLDYLTSSDSDSSDSEPEITSSLENGPMLEVTETKILTEIVSNKEEDIENNEDEDFYCDMQLNDECDSQNDDINSQRLGGEENSKLQVKSELGESAIASKDSKPSGDTEVTIAEDGNNSPVTAGDSSPTHVENDRTQNNVISSNGDSNSDDLKNKDLLQPGDDEVLEDYEAMDSPASSNKEEVEREEVKQTKKLFERKKSYSVSDVKICTRIIRLKISHYVSSLVSQGNDSLALSSIDKPLCEILDGAGAPELLLHYVEVQYKAEKTLMDTDTAFLISVVDAIRYKYERYHLVLI